MFRTQSQFKGSTCTAGHHTYLNRRICVRISRVGKLASSVEWKLSLPRREQRPALLIIRTLVPRLNLPFPIKMPMQACNTGITLEAPKLGCSSFHGCVLLSKLKENKCTE